MRTEISTVGFRASVRTALVAAFLLGAPLLGGCALFNTATPTPVTKLNLNRQTPKATYEYFKTMAQNNQWPAEWSVFSPNFKKLLNQSVGRNVDSGDYNLARQTVAANNTSEMRMLTQSTWVSARMINDRTAVATIEHEGRKVSPRLVKLTRWELKVVGDDTPYGDFVAKASDAIQISQDGAVTVRIRPPQATASLLRTFRPEQIESFKVEGLWYVDDFGGLDEQLVQQVDGDAPAGARRQPRVEPTPGPGFPEDDRFNVPGTPPSPGGGSPDGGSPDGSPDGGSPDGPPAGWGEPDPVRPTGPQEWGSPDG